MLIYKIFRRPEWDAFAAAGQTAGAPVDLADGYIHLSTGEQVFETVEKHFAEEDDLEIVALESGTLGPALKWEPSRGGELFPHLYRELRMNDVLWHEDVPLTDEGHVFPDDLE